MCREREEGRHLAEWGREITEWGQVSEGLGTCHVVMWAIIWK